MAAAIFFSPETVASTVAFGASLIAVFTVLGVFLVAFGLRRGHREGWKG